ncbi:TetR/AcrR family transcriptional regulator [Labedella endophytica]|nr:TetR/AcrR family transcriptional regulator [Labedella endophytica]
MTESGAPLRGSSKEQQIVDAALEILRDRGPASVNIESVSAVSGVAKSTIYRRFSNRDELLSVAVASVAAAPELPAGLDIVEELRWVTLQCRDGVEHILGLGGVTGVLVDQDPRFSTTIRSMLLPWVALVRDILVRGVATGRFRSDVDIEVALNFVLGASIGEFLRAGTASDAWTDRVLRMLLVMLLPSDGSERPDSSAGPDGSGHPDAGNDVTRSA